MKAGKSSTAIAIKLSDSEDEIVEIHTKIKEVEKYSEMLRHNLDEFGGKSWLSYDLDEF